MPKSATPERTSSSTVPCTPSRTWISTPGLSLPVQAGDARQRAVGDRHDRGDDDLAALFVGDLAHAVHGDAQIVEHALGDRDEFAAGRVMWTRLVERSNKATPSNCSTSVVARSIRPRSILIAVQDLPDAVVKLARQASEAVLLELRPHLRELSELGFVSPGGLEEPGVGDRARRLARDRGGECQIRVGGAVLQTGDDHAEQLVLEDERQPQHLRRRDERADRGGQPGTERRDRRDRRQARRRAQGGEVDRLLEVEAAAGRAGADRVGVDHALDVRRVPQQDEALQLARWRASSRRRARARPRSRPSRSSCE